MSDFKSFLKRGSPAAWPHEVTVIDDPKHPLYDPRIENPVTDERIRNLVLVGQIQPVSIRVDGDDGVLVAGRTRWKCATVINHLSGAHLYRGSLACIRDAIARNKGTDLEKLIADRCSKGMKLQFVLHRGDMSEATSAMVSENEQRDDDPLTAKIQRVQRLAKHGHSNDDMAVMFGVSAQTIGRWLGRDLSKSREKKVRGKATRPSAKRIAEIVEVEPATDVEANVLMGVRFASGHITEEDFFRRFPALAPAAKKGRAA